jgi:hypothetical protein
MAIPCFSALAHQPRAHTDAPETHDAAEDVQRQLESGLILHLHLYRLTVLREVRALGRNEQSVQVPLHEAVAGVSASAASSARAV